MMTRRTALAVVAVCISMGLSGREVAPQPADPINEVQVREWAAYAATKAAGDPKVFDDTMVKLVRMFARSYRADPFDLGASLHNQSGLRISVVGPVSTFQLVMSEAIRKMEPTDKLPWPCGATVDVYPNRVDSPDIEKIVVKRAGVVVEPKVNTLLPRQMTTRAGVNFTIHRGSVCYAPSVFAPGAEVTVIAIPAAGDNIIKTLGEADLKMII